MVFILLVLSLVGNTQSKAIIYDYPGFRKKESLIRTAFSAKDLMQIVDAVEPNGLLWYWGLLYRTVLGAAVAVMFPDRMKCILYHEYDVELWADSDTTFFKLHSRNLTLIRDLHEEPIMDGTTIIDSTGLRSYIRFSLYTPTNFPDISVALDSPLPPRNITVPSSLYGSQMGSVILVLGDARPQLSFDKMRDIFDSFNEKSRLVGLSGLALAMIRANWRIPAEERYKGDLKRRTRQSMLVIGNTYDIATPLRSVQNVSASFENSGLVESGSFGDRATAHGSKCSLPRLDTFCETSYGPFENQTVDGLLEEIGFVDLAERPKRVVLL
ncbi:hypothetical protein BJX76DRAFT_364346 [Aspergillus varians]